VSVACSVLVERGRAGRRLQALAWCMPALGLMSSVACLLTGQPVWLSSISHQADPDALSGLPFLTTLLATAALGFVWMACRAAWSRNAPSLLMLTEAGRVSLDGVPFDLYSISRLPGLIVLVLAPISSERSKLARCLFGPDRTRVLLLGKDAQSADQWRRLNVWLIWVERGTGAVAA